MDGIPESADTGAAPAVATPAAPQAHGATAGAAGGPPAMAEDHDDDQPLNMFGSPPRGGRTAAAAAAAAGGTILGSDGEGGEADASELESLRSNPEFLAMKTLIQEAPEMLPEVLSELASTNPQLLELISKHQKQFMEILFEGDEDMLGELDGMDDMEMEDLLGGDDEGAEDDEMVEGGAGGIPTLVLTEEDAAAIERLINLGFPKNACIEAYLICDKNEELAANYLLESAGMD